MNQFLKKLLLVNRLMHLATSLMVTLTLSPHLLFASHAEDTIILEITDFNQGLLKKLEDLEGTLDPNQQSTIRQDLLEKAQARAKKISDLLEKNPRLAVQAFAQISLTGEALERMKRLVPGSERSLENRDRKIRGTLAVLGVLLRQEYRETHFATDVSLELGTETSNGSSYTILISDELLDQVKLVNGSQVSIEHATEWAKPDGSKILMLVQKESSLQSAGGTTSTTTATASSPLNISGEQKTLVILLNFQDNTLTPATPLEIQNMIFSGPKSVSQYYRESSYGKAWVGGDVTGWYTIPYNSSGACDYSTWGNAATLAASKAGVNLANYSRKMFVFPRSKPGTTVATNCTFAGLGNLPGSNSWINASVNSSTLSLYDQSSVMAHELGHNLGVHHANFLSCSLKQIDTYSNCTNSEYGDNSDNMGFQYFLPNAPHQVAFGWINPIQNQIQTVTSNGVFTLSPLELGDSTLKVLKIRKPDTNEYYYVSLRRPLGSFDSVYFSDYNNVGASIHVWNGNNATQTKQLTARPYSLRSSTGLYLQTGRALNDGESFYDATNGVTITQRSTDNSSSSGSIEVEVKFGAIPCTRVTPTFYFTPVTKSANGGGAISYNLSIANNDSITCSPASFTITPALPSGWVQSPAVVTQVLVPISGANIPITITPSSNAASGAYIVSQSVQSDSQIGPIKLAQATINIVGGDIMPPSQVTGFTASTDGGRVSLNWNGSVDNIGVSQYYLYRVSSQPFFSTYLPSSARSFKDLNVVSVISYTYFIYAYDAAGNRSTVSSASIVVQGTITPDIEAPVVSISSPQNGDLMGRSVTVSGGASDNLGVVLVELYADNVKVASSTGSAFNLKWNAPRKTASGLHLLTIKAYDSSGNMGSASVSVQK